MKSRKKAKGPQTSTSRLKAALRFTDRALDYAALLLAQGAPPAQIETLIRQVRRKNSEILSVRPPKPSEIRAVIAELTPGCAHDEDPALLQNIFQADALDPLPIHKGDGVPITDGHICTGCPGVGDDCYPDTVSSCWMKASVVAEYEKKNRV